MPTVTLQPSQYDNWLRNESGYTTTNYGTDVNLRTAPKNTATYRSILAFDLSSIPTNRTVDSAVLSLYLKETSPADRTLNIHKILETWDELQSSWVNRLTGTAWTNAGCGTPTSASSTISASKLVTQTLGWFDWGPTAEMIADVQDWVSNPANNKGWMLKDSVEGIPDYYGKVFHSREGASGLTPKLVVTYHLAHSVTVAEVLGMSDAALRRADFKQAVAEILGMSDVVARQLAMKRAVSEVLGMRDSVEVRKHVGRLGDLPDHYREGGA